MEARSKLERAKEANVGEIKKLDARIEKMAQESSVAEKTLTRLL